MDESSNCGESDPKEVKKDDDEVKEEEGKQSKMSSVGDFEISCIRTTSDTLNQLENYLAVESLKLISHLLPNLDVETIFLLAGMSSMLPRRSRRIMAKRKIQLHDEDKFMVVAHQTVTFGRHTQIVILGSLLFRVHEMVNLTEILLMGVTQSKQCSGIGSSLLTFTKMLVRDQCNRIILKSDNRCIPFYEKNGFSRQVSIPDDFVYSCVFDTTESTLMEYIEKTKKY